MKNSMTDLSHVTMSSFTSSLVQSWRRLPSILRVVVAALLMQACKSDEAPVRGQLMVVLQTDMSLPKDVTQVKIQIKRDGTLYHDKNYIIAPGEDWVAKLPGTLAVIASVEEPTPRVEVVVIGLRGSEARVFAKSVTTIPERRIATLFVPIQWLCEGQVKKLTGNGDDAVYESSCTPSGGKERACRAGSCETIEVDESTLKDYAEEDVFGGAEKDSKLGRCFDTRRCFEAGVSVAPDDDCIVELEVPKGFGLNFGLLNPTNNDGIEFDRGPREGDRLVPLDHSSSFGWEYVKGTKATSTPVRAQLPKAVCRRLANDEFESVVASFSCESKTLAYPTCGPWTDIKVVGNVDAVSPQPQPTNTSSEPDAGPDAGPLELESLVIRLPDDEPIQIGVPVTLELLATPIEGGDPVDVASDAEWASEDEDVATVLEGKVTGHRAGSTVITAKFGGLTATFEVDVERGEPQSIDLSSAPKEPIAAGLPYTLTATAKYAGDEEEDVSELATWTSSDETIAAVEDGVITTYLPGTVTITATFEGVETETTIEVGEPVFKDFEFATAYLDTNVVQIRVFAVLTNDVKDNEIKGPEITDDVTWEQLSGEEFGVMDTDTGIVSVTAQGQIKIRVRFQGRSQDVTINVLFSGADAG